VKKIEAVAIGTDVQARLFTLAPADVIPWHQHSESTDYYFVLRVDQNSALHFAQDAPWFPQIIGPGEIECTELS
jgi:hypothetical protein